MCMYIYMSMCIFLETKLWQCLCENPNLRQDFCSSRVNNDLFFSPSFPIQKKSPYFSEQIKNIIAVMDSFTSHYDFVYFLGFFRVCVDCLQLLRLYMFTLPNAYCIKSVFYSNYLYFITFQYTAVSALGNCLFQNQQ